MVFWAEPFKGIFFPKKIASFPLSIKLIENDAALICFITDVEI